MSEWAIEKGKPISARDDSGATRYPWKSMEAGDSFLVPVTGRPVGQLQRAMSSSGTAWCLRHRHDLRVVTRIEDGGVRVWLVNRGASV